MPIQKINPVQVLSEDRLKELQQVVPEAFADGKVNWTSLKTALGEHLEETENTNEHFGLFWPGKQEAKRFTNVPSTGTLVPVPGEGINEDTTENVFIEGENLEVLKILRKSYTGKIKMIYIDPPYNTGNDFIYDDNFTEPLQEYLRRTGQVDEEGRALTTNKKTDGRFHSKWLSMMYPRLELARDLLREDGVIFISIDDNEVANLRLICDEIFGSDNFITNIIWQHSVQPKGYTDIFSVHHNHILVYRKSEKYKIHALPRTEEDNKNYSNPDNDPKGYWRSGDVRNALYRPNLIYDIVTPSGKVISPPENGWRWSKETVQEKISTGEILFSDDETRIIRKIYLANQTGRAPETIWFGKDVGVTRDGANQLKSLFEGKAPFDTVKPIGLIQRLLKLAGVTKKDIVLDFFAGSCSVAHAVIESNTGYFVVIQFPEIVDDNLPSGKIAKELNLLHIADVGKERIRRASNKLKEENPMHHGDLGFKVVYEQDRGWESAGKTGRNLGFIRKNCENLGGFRVK